MPCRAVAAAGWGCWGAQQSNFQLSSSLPPASSSFLPREELKSVSSSHPCPALETQGGQEPPRAPVHGSKFQFRVDSRALTPPGDPGPLVQVDLRVGRALLCQFWLHLTTLMQLNSRYSHFGKLFAGKFLATGPKERRTIHQRAFIPSSSAVL